MQCAARAHYASIYRTVERAAKRFLYNDISILRIYIIINLILYNLSPSVRIAEISILHLFYQWKIFDRIAKWDFAPPTITLHHVDVNNHIWKIKFIASIGITRFRLIVDKFPRRWTAF